MYGLLIVLSATVVLNGSQSRPAMSVSGDTVIIPRGVVMPIEDVKVPAQEQGTLIEFNVEDGVSVAKGQVLAQIDDSQVREAEKVAHWELEAAKVEAASDVAIRYAQASRDVNKANLDKERESNSRMPGTYPETELREIWLKVRESELSIEKAGHDMDIAKAKVHVNEAKESAAKLDVDRRQVKSPVDGMVIKRFAHRGEWVKPGDPVLQVVRMDKMWVEGFVHFTGTGGVAPGEISKQPVSVKFTPPHGHEETFHGQVIFASPLVENGEDFQIRAEVVNRRNGDSWLLLPGTNAELTIQMRH
jgi:multidrug resistance efflux pump